MKNRALFWTPLGITALISGVMMAIWAFEIPIFESPDEPLHWANAQYIYAQHALPPYDSTYLEGNQAPLYYLLISPFASSMETPPSLVRTSESGAQLLCPPRFFQNCPGDGYRYWPIRRARLLSILIGLVGVVFTGLGALEISGDIWTACLAAGLVGLLPQFDFRASSVNNDVSVASFSAVALYFILRMVIRQYTVRDAVVASVGVGLAILSKINAGVLLPVFAVAILFSAGDWLARTFS